MIREADSNGDGQLSFLEWFNWLSDSSAITSSTSFSRQGQGGQDPMVSSLQTVLQHAVTSLRYLAASDSIKQPTSTCTIGSYRG